VANIMGARFTGSRTDLLPVLEELRKRGLMFVDGRPAAQTPPRTRCRAHGAAASVSDRTLDGDATREAIDRRLSELEEVARRRGARSVVGYVYPVTVAPRCIWRRRWRRRGLALAPVSALGVAPGAGK